MQGFVKKNGFSEVSLGKVKKKSYLRSEIFDKNSNTGLLIIFAKRSLTDWLMTPTKGSWDKESY